MMGFGSIFSDFRDSSVLSWVREEFDPEIEQKPFQVPVVKASKKLDIFKFIAAGVSLALASGASTAVARDVAGSRVAVEAHQSPGGGFNILAPALQASSGSASLSASFNSASEQNALLKLEDTISVQSRTALGAHGILRLREFASLGAGWDDGVGERLNLQSLEKLDSFFHSTNLSPERIGLFMSQDGNLITNWASKSGHIIELEFLPSSISVFTEDDGVTVVLGQSNTRLVKTLIEKTHV